MIPNKLTLKLHPSNTYLGLTLLVYLLGLFASWHYFFNLYLSIVISLLLSIWFYYFLPKIRLTKPNAIIKIVLDEARILIEKNSGLIQQYPWFYPAYQSRFLVIINAGEAQIVIFKDAVNTQSFSALNRTINAHT